MDELKRAAGYIRVSTAEQSTKGLSIETQIAEIKAYAEYHKMKLVDIYADRGITARKSLEKRVDFMRMMGDVQSGKINHIIVLRLDRFFRNVFDYHKMMNEYLTPNNCDWSAVKEQYTTTTTNGRLMINLRLAIAEQECDTDSDRIKDVFTNRVRNGYAITGSLPWGYKIENKRVIIDPEKRELFEDMLNYVEQSCSANATLRYMLNMHGVSFSYTSLSKLLKNPILYGKYRDNENYCEGIITKQRFEKIREILNRNIKVQSEKTHEYIFSRMLVCANCGHRMKGTHYSNYSYYRCGNHYNERRCDNDKSINEIKIEQYLLENIERLIKEEIQNEEEYRFKIEHAKKPKKSNRAAIEKKLQKLVDIYLDDRISREDYEKKQELLKSQIIDEPEEIIVDLTPLKEFLESNILDVYHTLNIAQKRAAWRKIIKEIKIYRSEVKDVVFFKPHLY